MKKILIYNAYLMPMKSADIACGFLSAEDGKITGLGDMTACPAHEEFDFCVDAQGGFVLPGLIDAHTHLGLYEDSLGFEGADGNEDTDPTTPHLRVLDAINPTEHAFAEARAAGVTCCAVSPGSANPMGGQIAVIKTYGHWIDRMLVKAPAAMKWALGENPKTVYHDKDETPVTRMATAAILREALKKAGEYAARCQKAEEGSEEEMPEFEMKYDALRPLMQREISAHIHAHRTDDIFTGLRICKEFGLRPVIVHGTSAHKIAQELSELSVPVLSGPFLTDRSKPELHDLTERSPGILSRAGVTVAITTDHPEIPVKYLMHCAQVAAEHGMDEREALRAITCYPAEILGLGDRIGSLQTGMDADFVLFSAHPFAFRARPLLTVCDGQIVFEQEMWKEERT